MAILPRQYYGSNNCGYDRYNNYVCYNSGWYNWGRWVLLAIILIGAFLIFFLFARMGYQPYRGTAWALGRNRNNAQPHYQQQQQPYYQQQAQSQPYYSNNNNTNAPPAYQPGNAGYYGNTDPNVQQPQAAYKPPEGPPPNRV